MNKIGTPFNSIFSWYIKKRIHQIELFHKYPFEVQRETLFNLIEKAKSTEFGEQHGFKSIRSYYDFKNQVPICRYENLTPYVKRLKNGEQNILWPSPG